MTDYRKERVKIIIESVYNLVRFLPMDITKLEAIPFKDLQDMRKKIDEWLSLVNRPDREGTDSHLSPIGHDAAAEDKIKNHFSINKENFEDTPAKTFKKLVKGEA